MFENLDDPQPPAPAPIGGVTARGRRLRAHRRMVVGAAVAFVLAGTIATAAALQSDGHGKVVVSNEPSSTTVSDTAATTSTTVDETTTTTRLRMPSVLPSPTTTTTQPPHDPSDLSKLSIDYGEPLRSLTAGDSLVVGYQVTNLGSWDVVVSDECTPLELWTSPATSAWAPYTEGIWPQPYPRRGPTERSCAGRLVISAGESARMTETILAGYRDADGNVMPTPPGFTAMRASFRPVCDQPCYPHVVDTLPITVTAPTWPPPGTLYTITVKTMHPKAAAGDSAPVEMTYSNPLGFTVRMPLFGPCWTVKTGTATVDCSGPRPSVVIGPFRTVDLVGTIWARKGFVATGAPLAPGPYKLDLGDLQGTHYALGGEFPYLTVT